MKIAVYTIAKNEEQFVERWAKSCEEADHRFILDTGSTDATVHLANKNNIRVWGTKVDPWRFDTARNLSLELLPKDIDICIALDMDEVLIPGWRAALEKIPNSVTRPRYKYVWSWNKDGSEGLVYGGDKIHARHGYRWEHPVHEVLKPDGIVESQHWVDGLEIHHHPDPSKSRSQYFDLLKLAVDEKPKDDRNQFYLAREYFFRGQYEMAQYHFSEFLKISNWPPERAAARRYVAQMRPDHAEGILYQAVAEDPSRRETWVALAKLYYERRDWRSVRACCEMVFRVTLKPLDYLCDAEAWGWLPHDLMALASYHLGDVESAWEHGAEAVALAPDDERLRANLRWYRE